MIRAIFENSFSSSSPIFDLLGQLLDLCVAEVLLVAGGVSIFIFAFDCQGVNLLLEKLNLFLVEVVE
jgi:hypothetical protein